MTKKRLVESCDIFCEDDWIGDVKDIENRLYAISNPYRGNKRKLLFSLAKVMREEGLYDDLPSSKVLDLFSGSAFASIFFKSLGASVWSNDLLAFSALSALAFVESPAVFASESDMHKIVWGESDADRFIRDNYSGQRFTEDESERLDIIRKNIETKYTDWGSNLFEITNAAISSEVNSFLNYDKPVDEILKHNDLFRFSQEIIAILHYVMKNCDLGGRLNNGQVVAEVNHRLSRHKMNFHNIHPYSFCVPQDRMSTVTRMDAIELLQTLDKHAEFDIVYIDPPYGGDQSDYAHMYNFFEDFLGFADKHSEEEKKRFTKTKSYRESFEELLSKLPANACWIFSYNDSSWATSDEISDCIKNYSRSRVAVHEVDYNYQYRAKDNAAGKEYLIVAHP